MKILAANYIFLGHGEPLRNAALRVSDDGVLLEILNDFKEAERISFYDGILCPCMINAHCHTELGAMKAKIPAGKGLHKFVQSVVQVRQAESLSQATSIRYDKHNYLQGIDAIADICNSTDTVPWKKDSSILYRNFVEVFGSNPAFTAEVWTKTQEVLEQFNGLGGTCGITPHALYSMSTELLHRSLLAGFESGTVSMHFRESMDEEKMFSSISDQNYSDYFIEQLERIPWHLRQTAQLLLVHCTYATAEEITRILDCVPNTSIVLCPQSNLYIENKLANIPDLRTTRAKICIGTDSLASNTELNVLEEILCIHRSFPEIPFFELLQWVCKNGAESLDFNHLGQWKIGKPIHICHIEGLNLSTFLPVDKAYTKRI